MKNRKQSTSINVPHTVHSPAMDRLPSPGKSRIKAAVLAEMTRRAMTPYALWKACDEKVGRTSINEWLAQDRDLRSSSLEVILEVLALDIGPRKSK